MVLLLLAPSSSRRKGRNYVKILIAIFVAFTINLITLQLAIINSSSDDDDTMTLSIESYNNGDNVVGSVLSVDTSTIHNARMNAAYSRSTTAWEGGSWKRIFNYYPSRNNLKKFITQPLAATIDKRPMTMWMQLSNTTTTTTVNKTSIGCAFNTHTMVSEIGNINLDSFKARNARASVCFTYGSENRELWPPSLMEGGKIEDDDDTVCIAGVNVRVHASLAIWQQRTVKRRPVKTGYPYTVDFTLPNSVPSLTCRAISERFNSVINTDDDGLQHIYIKVVFALQRVHHGDHKTFRVTSTWPWSGISTPNDDRRSIALNFPSDGYDSTSKFIPKTAEEMRLAIVEGPSFTQYQVKANRGGSNAYLMSSRRKESRGAAHPRLVTTLLQQGRVCPNSTRIIGTLDGQVHATIRTITRILKYRLDKVLTTREIRSWFIGISSPAMSVGEYLATRGIKVRLAVLPMPAYSFNTLLIGGQYAFSSYVLARYAEEFQVMMYSDGDAAVMETPGRFSNSNSFKQEVYDVMFSRDNDFLCADKRMHLIEHSVEPLNHGNIPLDDLGQAIECTNNFNALDSDAWNDTKTICEVASGNILARSDSAMSLDVHFLYSEAKYRPLGVKHCQRYPSRVHINISSFIELHMTAKYREAPECQCRL